MFVCVVRVEGQAAWPALSTGLQNNFAAVSSGKKAQENMNLQAISDTQLVQRPFLQTKTPVKENKIE